MGVRVLSAKLPDELIVALGIEATAQGVSRNWLVRDALEAMVDGRVVRLSERERLARDLRDGMRRDLEALRQTTLADRSK